VARWEIRGFAPHLVALKFLVHEIYGIVWFDVSVLTKFPFFTALCFHLAEKD